MKQSSVRDFDLKVRLSGAGLILLAALCLSFLPGDRGNPNAQPSALDLCMALVAVCSRCVGAASAFEGGRLFGPVSDPRARRDVFIAMRTNSSLSQLWSVSRGVGIGALPTFVSEITSAAAPVPPELGIRRELRLVYRSKAKQSPAILAAVSWLRECFNRAMHPCFADTYIDPKTFIRDSSETNIVNIFPSTFDGIK